MNTGSLLKIGAVSTALALTLVRSGAGGDENAQGIGKVTTGHSAAGAGFKFDAVPPPAINDAGSKAAFSLVTGERDRNGADFAVLSDGKVPAGNDEPSANFFFRGGTKRGRIAVDLGEPLPLQSVATYSWHTGVRGPQVYKLYAADGSAKEFTKAPAEEADPASCGWTLLASVDTRPKNGEGGGQHGVSIALEGGTPPAAFRYLLFDVQPSHDRDDFGQTFFSEIDIIAVGGPELQRIKAVEKILKSFPTADGKYKFMIDASDAPDLLAWAEKELVPVVHEWYPKMVAMLPGEGYTAPDEVMLQFKSGINVPAFASGNQVTLNAPWFRKELEREARGCVVHELVHVVQQYGRARLRNPNPARTPGWIVEGIPDYIRWFLFEPQAKGAEITTRNWERARFDGNYRISANFLDWVVATYPKEKDIIRKLNAACREGKYSPDLWKGWTGKTVEELGTDWKNAHAARLGISGAAK
jgi:Peptidase of plants and bacteria